MRLDRRPDKRQTIVLKWAGKDVARLDSQRKSKPDDSSTADAKENEERLNRLAERWRYDSDSQVLNGVDGNEEEDRTLCDDFDPKYVLSLLST